MTSQTSLSPVFSHTHTQTESSAVAPHEPPQPSSGALLGSSHGESPSQVQDVGTLDAPIEQGQRASSGGPDAQVEYDTRSNILSGALVAQQETLEQAQPARLDDTIRDESCQMIRNFGNSNQSHNFQANAFGSIGEYDGQSNLQNPQPAIQMIPESDHGQEAGQGSQARTDRPDISTSGYNPENIPGQAYESGEVEGPVVTRLEEGVAENDTGSHDSAVTTTETPEGAQQAKRQRAQQVQSAPLQLEEDQCNGRMNDTGTQPPKRGRKRKAQHDTTSAQAPANKPVGRKTRRPQESNSVGDEETHQAPVKKPRKTRSDKGTKRKNPSQEQQPDAMQADTEAINQQNEKNVATVHTQASEQSEPATADAIRHQVKTTTRARRGRKPRASNQNAPSTDNDQANEPAPASDALNNPPTRHGRRPRSPTPTDAEDQRIDPGDTSMWDLTRDNRSGPMSKLERAFRKINWDDVKQRQEEERRRALETADADDPTADHPDEVGDRLDAADRAANPTATHDTDAPAMKIVNGQLVFDTSRPVDASQAHAEAEAAAAELDPDAGNLEESDLTRQTNTHSYIGSHKRDRVERLASSRGAGRWNEEATERFYDALRIFGADFTIIQKMFPNRTRRQIKLKFVREERTDPVRIKEVMVGPTEDKLPMTLQQYAEWTGLDEGDFREPEELEAELAAEWERQRKELDDEAAEVQARVMRRREKAKERQKTKERVRQTRKKKGQVDNSEEIVEEDGGSPVAEGGAQEVDAREVFADGVGEVSQTIEA